MKRDKRANPPVCWECGRQLYGGGWYYKTVKDEAGNEHSAHHRCDPEGDDE